MKASVILPVYNKAPWLQACLDSILAQDFRDFELIAVDDASTDDSPGILQACDDPRMRVIALQHNVGPGLAAQHAMNAASGEYLLRVDADDILLPERFRRQVELLESDPALGVCGSALALMHEPTVIRRLPVSHADCTAGLLFGVAVYQPTMALRRAVVQAHNIAYRAHWPRYGEDWMFQLELARVTRFANIQEPLIIYREGPQNISHGRDRWADLAFLFAHALTTVGMETPRDEQLELHAMAVKFFRRDPDAAMVRDFKRYLDGLVSWNDASSYFDQEAFRARTDQAWHELLYHLPHHGLGVVMSYMRAGGRMDAARLYYVMRALLSSSREDQTPAA